MRLLFLCTGNSCRSQMAEGWARFLRPDVDVWSAGSDPAERVSPEAIEAMAEVGIDLSGHFPKTLADVPPVDVVVAVCSNAAEACPMPPESAKFVRCTFDDPADAQGNHEERMVVFRAVRDQIREALRRHLDEWVELTR